MIAFGVFTIFITAPNTPDRFGGVLMLGIGMWCAICGGVIRAIDF